MLTAGVPPQDELPDLVVDEDEEAVGKGAEPPGDPAPNRNGQVSRKEDLKTEPGA